MAIWDILSLPLTMLGLSCSAPTVAEQVFPDEWTIALQYVTASQGTVPLGPNNINNICSPAAGCTALIDTGTFDIAVPTSYYQAVLALLGLPANPTLIGGDVTGRTLISAQGYPKIDCGALALDGPSLDFQIQDRIYSLAPNEYIFQYRQNAKNQPITPVCAVVIEPTGSSALAFILGDPFIAKFPETFFGQGNIATAQPRGVIPNAGQANGGGGKPEQDICFYGTVPVRAVCAPPIVLPVTDALTCQADISAAALLDEVNLANRVAGFRGQPGTPLGPPSTQYSLQPVPMAGEYMFPGGQTSTVTLIATTPTVPVSVDSCQTTITVPLVKPTAVCTPTLTLPATQGCAAHPNAAALIASINAGSTPGSGGPLTITLNPPAPAGGVYTLPVGTYPISVTVSNCAGSDTCSTLVTVSDQEQLDASKISCGALPTDGIVETPLLTKDKTTPVATFSPSYTKTNGCPTTLITDNLSCRNCLVGSNKEQQGSWDHCDSSITSKGVNIFPEQIGRVAWTVRVEDQADHEATADCAICADHGDKTFTTLGHCPKPFTTATPCDFGNL